MGELDKDRILGLLAMCGCFDNIVELSIAYQERRITAHDFAETVANWLAEAEPLLRMPV